MPASKYINDEKKRLEQTIEKRKELEKELEMPRDIDDAYMKTYEELRLVIIREKTIKSRIYNFGKDKGIISNYTVFDQK